MASVLLFVKKIVTQKNKFIYEKYETKNKIKRSNSHCSRRTLPYYGKGTSGTKIRDTVTAITRWEVLCQWIAAA